MTTSESREIPASPGCFVCGTSLPGGLNLSFFSDGKQAWTTYTPSEMHQGYDGVLHGGIISTLLDEVMAKAIIASGFTAVTAKLEVRFRRPAHTGQPYLVKGWVREAKGRIFHAQAVMESAAETQAGSEVIAEAEGVFVRQSR